MSWPDAGDRCVQIGGGRRRGTVLTDVWSGYVTVAWDSGRTETDVHIADIRQEQ